MQSEAARGHDGIGTDVLVLALESAGDAIAIVGPAPSGRVELMPFAYVNRAFETLYQCPRDEVVGATLQTFFATRSSHEAFARACESLRAGRPFSHTRELRRPDGSSVWIDVNLQPFAGGHWIYIVRDITQARRDQMRIAQLLSAVERGSEPIAIYTVEDGTWRYEYVNEAFLILTGFNREEIVGISSSTIASSAMDVARIERNRNMLLEGQTVRGEAQLHRKDGSIVVLEFTSKPLRDEATGSVTSAVTMFRDVTESRTQHERLVWDANHDSLTELFNRNRMQQALEESLARTSGSAQAAVLFIDLDGFKAINDRYGHDFGDQVLRSVARSLRASIWNSDILARWGGDEFAALVFQCTLEDAAEIGERMIASVAALKLGVGASVGVTMLRVNVADALRRADLACYTAKRNGGNRVERLA